MLAALELFHPAHFTADPGMSAFLSHPQAADPHFNAIKYFGPEWWFLMHMLQTPLVVVVSFGLLLLTGTFGAFESARFAPLAWISRVATVIFMIYYTVLDGIGGIGLGRQLYVLNRKGRRGRGDRRAGGNDPALPGPDVGGSVGRRSRLLLSVSLVHGRCSWPRCPRRSI